MNNPKPPTPKAIISTDITENLSSAVISFPKRYTIDQRRIELACKQSKYYRDPFIVDTTCSSSSFCKHNSLYELAQLVNYSSLDVKCPNCQELVNLLTLVESDLHSNHNPRTRIAPPTASVNSCPNALIFLSHMNHTLIICS